MFDGGKTLEVTLTTPGTSGSDNTLDVYATLPAGDVVLAADMDLLVQFQVSANAYDKYTAYRKIDSGTTFVQSGSSQYLGINCSNIASYANASTTNIGESTNPYLIGDQHQMEAISGELAAGETKYFKLVDDIDMTSVSWTKLNPSPFTKAVNFNGNNKKISKLGASLFEDFNGTIADLTIEDATVSGGSAITGILANTIQTAASTITNVDITGTSTSAPYSSTVTSTKGTGGLIGEVDNVGGVTMATISGCDVTYTSVSGAGAGGLMYFANAKVSVDNCSYSGATISSSARYTGGMIGSTANYASVISNCRVEDSTISTSVTSTDPRLGGLIGMIHTGVQVKGCSVGTELKKVSLSLPTPASASTKYNAGGFVGVCYGTVTKNSDVRNKAYVTITSSNPSAEANSDYQLDLGGFVGYLTGTIEYSDAVVTMDGICGKYVGGFCGYCPSGGTGATISNSTVTGTVSGNLGTGGFVGYAEVGEFTNCTSSATVSRTGSWGASLGSFGGIVNAVTMTKCSATSNISINAGYIGGFLGGIETGASKTTTIQKCWSTGVVTSSTAQCGGFIGHIAANASGIVNVSDCYVTGNVVETNQRQGGLIGQINSGVVTISRCYASGSVTGSFAVGGLVGYMNIAATIENCVAWNSSVTPGTYGSGNWSSGAVIGVTFPTGCTLTDNYRNPSMSLTAWWVPDSDYNHPNVSSGAITVKDTSTSELRLTTATSLASGQDNRPQYAYHGKVDAGKTLSQLASTTLGWSSEIWDFSGALPTLK